MEIADIGLSIVLLESGGTTFDAATQELNRGTSIGIQYDSLERVRSRWLGGSSNCWGGWCKPLDEIDMGVRAWMPDSGWPFGLETLGGYYERAHPYLGLDVYDYSEKAWAKDLARRGLATFRLEESRIANRIVQFSPPMRFGRAYRGRLAASRSIQVLLWSNLTQIIHDDHHKPVSLIVKTLSGNRFVVAAKAVVLAAGGIENARILLNSRHSGDAGLGNAHDVVGRYFMDHPRVQSACFRLRDAKAHRRLYDSRLAKTRRRWRRNPEKIAAFVTPTAATQTALQLPNSRSYLVGRYLFENSRFFEALSSLRGYAVSRNQFGSGRERDVAALLKRCASGLIVSPQGTLGLLDRIFAPHLASRRFSLETVIEPIPHRDSRISLSSEQDRLGMHRVVVDWRLTEQDRRNIDATTRLLAAEIVDQQVGSLVADGPPSWDGRINGCWHHMGTTRMHRDPRKGVVDRDLRLHGARKVFCLGSSVFPTAGSDCPTLTLVALAIRLADWFKQHGAAELAGA